MKHPKDSDDGWVLFEGHTQGCSGLLLAHRLLLMGLGTLLGPRSQAWASCKLGTHLPSQPPNSDKKKWWYPAPTHPSKKRKSKTVSIIMGWGAEGEPHTLIWNDCWHSNGNWYWGLNLCHIYKAAEVLTCTVVYPEKLNPVLFTSATEEQQKFISDRYWCSLIFLVQWPIFILTIILPPLTY